MQTKQTKSKSPGTVTVATEPAQRATPSAADLTRLPAWTHAWGDRPPAGLLLHEAGTVPGFQAKLTVSQQGDPYEQEADRVADQVMCMSASSVSVQRKCACGGTPGPSGECEECTNKQLALQPRSTTQIRPTTVPSVVSEVLQSANGEPLDAATRAFMEPRFGQSFSEVRIHSGETAAKSARSVNARAYTVGRDIVFGAAQYTPETASGRRLLAHELTHVLQQQAVQTDPTVQKARSDESAASSYNIDDTISRLALALSVATSTLADPELPSPQREKIEQQVEKLQPLVTQLQQARGTDGEGLTFDFDPDPKQNEIRPGDAERNLDDLYAGFAPPPQGEADSLPAARDTAEMVQATALPGGLHITPISTPGLQRCEAICVGIIILSGLLLAGCQSSSKKVSSGPCTGDQLSIINQWHSTATQWMNDAMTKITSVRDGKAVPDVDTVVMNALDHNFHTRDRARIQPIIQGLTTIQTMMNGHSFKFMCECTNVDPGMQAYTIGSGNDVQIHICPGWFSSSDDIRRITTIIHEMGHAVGFAGSVPVTSGKVEDIYEFHDGYRTMSTDQAMKNPEPYAVFVREVFHMGKHPPGTHR